MKQPRNTLATLALCTCTLLLTLSPPAFPRTNPQQGVSKAEQELRDWRERLQTREKELAALATQLEQTRQELVAREQKLRDQIKAFEEKVAGKRVDRQVLDTYQNMTPNQAAQVLLDLYQSQKELAVLLLRKLPGDSAGEILGAMLQLNRAQTSALARDALIQFDPRNP